MRTLLVADDSITIQRVIALTFAEERFRVVTVSDGQEAIDRIVSQPPDIVLAGTTMPGVNGYDVARFVRNQPALEGVPVLLLTGAFESVDAARLAASGASGILEKPFEPATVISRVKELLGLKKEARPTPAAGRLVTAADVPRDKKGPGPSPTVARGPEPAASHSGPAPSQWDELRKDSGLQPNAGSVEGAGQGSTRDDYLDTLDAAFDSLDQHLAGRPGESRGPRNPSPPLSRADAVDPRSPGRRPVPEAEPAANPIFDVDDEWFETDDTTDGDRAAEQKQLAGEMGIHDLELPEVEVLANDLDFDFGLEAKPSPATDARLAMLAEIAEAIPEPGLLPAAAAKQAMAAELAKAVEEAAPHASAAAEAPPVFLAPVAVFAPATPAVTAVPRAAAAPPAPVVPAAPVTPAAPAPVTSSLDMADAFAALLAFEQGEPAEFPVAEEPDSTSVASGGAAPALTSAMLDQIAARVADRLNGGLFEDHLRDAIARTVRDTVRSVVSETSERLIRDEIARVRARAERDAQ